jgi:hypothetical protein
MSLLPLPRPLSGACLTRVGPPGVPLRSTPGFNPAHPSGACEYGGSTRSCSRSFHPEPQLLHAQRQRREGIQPGVERSGTPGNHPLNPEPLARGDGKANQSEVPIIKGQSVRLQDDFEFLEKRDVPMMFFLSLDVPPHLRDLRFTHRECTVAFLPRESSDILEGPRNPTGRIRLYLTDELRDRLVLPQLRQDVHMIGGSVDDQRDSFFIADSATEVLMNTEADCGSQPRLTPLGRKNNVIEQVAMGGTHSAGPFRRPCSGAALFLDHTPGVPLRSTPGFNPPHPPGAATKLPKDTQGRRVLAPEARRNRARSEAKQTPGIGLHVVPEPLARGGGIWIGLTHSVRAGQMK